jgi:integrase
VPKLTKSVVESAPVDHRKPSYLWDDQLPSFGVKILPTGSRRYVLKYRAGAGGRTATQRWATLGTHGAITCDQARSLAQQTLAAIAKGEDPQALKFAQRGAPRLDDIWNRFEAEQLPLKKASTARDYKQIWRDVIGPELGTKFVKDIRGDQIDRLHKKLVSTPYSANRTLALLSRLFNVAEAWGMRERGSNPCKHVERFKERSRERYLTSTELSRLGQEIEKILATGEVYPEAAAAIRLLLLTGARLNEVLQARWAWVSFEKRTIMLPDSKTGKKDIFLSVEALKVLDWIKTNGRDPSSPYILPGRTPGKPLNNLSKSWRRLCKQADLAGVRLHDLRHTAASIAAGEGASLSLIGRLLGHSQAQTTLRYAHIDVDPALRVADQLGINVAAALDKRSESSKVGGN